MCIHDRRERRRGSKKPKTLQQLAVMLSWLKKKHSNFNWLPPLYTPAPIH
jgi:hypothetical protein